MQKKEKTHINNIYDAEDGKEKATQLYLKIENK